MFRLIFASLILIFALSFNSFSQTREVPKGWKEIKECGVSFLVPKNMKKKRDDVTPIDSCFATYKNSTMTVGIDHDNYMAKPEETSFESLEIDGKKAWLINKPNGLQVYMGMIGEGEYERFSFTMGIYIKKADNAQTARKIIESIRFVQEN
jgi:hypothetical protein